MAIDWKTILGVGNLNETPVRRATGIVRPEPSPGTPPQDTGMQTVLRIVKPTDVAAQKFAQRFGRMLALSNASPLDGYISDVLPALALNIFGSELFFPDEILGWGTGVAIADAANFSRVVLQNPLNSGVLGIVTYISGSQTVAGTLGLFEDTGTQAGNTAFARDGRIVWAPGGGNGGAKLQVTSDHAGAVSGQGPVQQKTVAANGVAEWGSQASEAGFVILVPNTRLILTPAIVNIGVTGEFRWREIAIKQA